MRKFIRHPIDIPVEISNMGREIFQPKPVDNICAEGMCFESENFVPVGSTIDIKIHCSRPLFITRGQVVWCKKKKERYSVGVQFTEGHEAFRLRMVEQVCYIEVYKKNVLEKEGRALSTKEAAQEWIDKYAASFPDIKT